MISQHNAGGGDHPVHVDDRHDETPRESDEELLARAKSQAGGLGFEVFYDRYYDQILSYFARRVRQAETAADLTAETMAQALNGLSRFDSARGTGSQWIYGIARHLLFGYWRSLRVEEVGQRRLSMRQVAVDLATASYLERIDRTDAARAAAAALDRLPSGQAEAVRFRIVDELAYGEIGRRIGCGPAAARVRVHRGLRALRRAMEDYR